jgi:hypothetical protein
MYHQHQIAYELLKIAVIPRKNNMRQHKVFAIYSHRDVKNIILQTQGVPHDSRTSPVYIKFTTSQTRNSSSWWKHSDG